MPKFLIDFQDGDASFEDREGSECRDLHQAQVQAVDVLRQAVRDQIAPGNDRSFACTVRDEHRKAMYVATVEFRCRPLSDEPLSDRVCCSSNPVG